MLNFDCVLSHDVLSGQVSGGLVEVGGQPRHPSELFVTIVLPPGELAVSARGALGAREATEQQVLYLMKR